MRRDRRRSRKRVCNFCVDKVEDIDYKDINRLKKYITERGKILPRRISGNCASHHSGIDFEAPEGARSLPHYVYPRYIGIFKGNQRNKLFPAAEIRWSFRAYDAGKPV